MKVRQVTNFVREVDDLVSRLAWVFADEVSFRRDLKKLLTDEQQSKDLYASVMRTKAAKKAFEDLEI